MRAVGGQKPCERAGPAETETLQLRGGGVWGWWPPSTRLLQPWRIARCQYLSRGEWQGLGVAEGRAGVVHISLHGFLVGGISWREN